MTEIDILKQDILDRYNLSWVEAHIEDNIGVIQLAKDNFKELVETLITKTFQQGLNAKN